MENKQTDERLRELDEAYGYATRFLQAFCENNDLSPVEPLPTLCGVLTQIDNATAITSKLRVRLRELEGALQEAEDALKYAAGCDINEHCGHLIETALIRTAKALEMSAETKPDQMTLTDEQEACDGK